MSVKPVRIKIASDGGLRLPEEVRERLGWKTGSYLEVSVEGSDVRLHPIELDLFAEALETPDPSSFDRIIAKQKKSQEDAARFFEEKIQDKDLPEIRPEDKPDFWR
jgi:AbrB family looped-hinge helix DNA binding protein